VAPEPVLPTVEPPRPATGRARGDGHADREAELRLIRQAQEAAAGERFEAALGFLAEHARRFPGGRLVEEREALRIRSLAKSGRVAEARRAAKAFRARFPRSVLLPRIGDLPPE
jgi:outer membrane protein assembly factor BamD (BamD/ComL family)